MLSHNCFESVDVQKLTKLTKLSLAHNVLQSIPDTSVRRLLFVVCAYAHLAAKSVCVCVCARVRAFSTVLS